MLLSRERFRALLPAGLDFERMAELEQGRAVGEVSGVLPDRETLEGPEGYTLRRTDRNGWVEVATDGYSMGVEAER